MSEHAKPRHHEQQAGGATPAKTGAADDHDADQAPKAVATRASVPGAGGINIGTLEAFIADHEGKRNKVYTDSTGNPTIGIGFNLNRGASAHAAIERLGLDFNKVVSGQQTLTDGQIDELFKEDLGTAIQGAQSVFGPTFDSLNAARKIVIIDMVFNMGSAGVGAFHQTIANIKKGDFTGAAAQMLQSAWAGQVGRRATQDAAIMKSGQLSGADAGGGQDHGGGQQQGSGGATTQPQGAGGGPSAGPSQGHLKQSVGLGGKNDPSDVRQVQSRLKERGIDPGGIDGLCGHHTIQAIEAFQRTFLDHPDGLISPGHGTEKHLFGESGQVHAPNTPAGAQGKGPGKAGGEQAKGAGNGATETHAQTHAPGQAGQDEPHPTYDLISKNFGNGIPGSSHFTWHDALYLPSWGRHVKPSDVTNVNIDVALANIQRQAAALDKVRDHFGKAINIHCWLRPPLYNKAIGGAGNSAHLRGTATDFDMSGLSAEAVRKVLIANPDIYPGTGELGVSWVHIDLEHRAWF